MPAADRIVTIPVTSDEAVSAVLHLPENMAGESPACVAIAHGAGNDRDNPLLAAFAAGLADAGYIALRFEPSRWRVQTSSEPLPAPHHRRWRSLT